MTKEQIKQETEKKEQVSNDSKTDTKLAEEKQIEKNEVLPEQKITDLEDKLTRTFAEMENQRRRFEKEKEDAFEYGGFAFAREALTR